MRSCLQNSNIYSRRSDLALASYAFCLLYIFVFHYQRQKVRNVISDENLLFDSRVELHRSENALIRPN